MDLNKSALLFVYSQLPNCLEAALSQYGELMTEGWTCLSLGELLTVAYLLLHILLVLLSSRLLAGFIASKPEGRKTVMGQFPLTVLF